MKKKARILIIIFLTAILTFTSASAAIDYLFQYRSKVSVQALSAAQNVVPIVSLTGEELSLYRLGYAAGYDAAIQSQSVLTRSSNESDINTYILNNWTKKFHKPTCEYALQISVNNKRVFYCSRNDMINQGYIPCKVCQP